MFDLGALIIPSDIVAAIDQSLETGGWLSGGMLESERVFCAPIAKIGASTKVSSLFDELVCHRTYQPLRGTVKDELIRWAKVEDGFYQAYPAFRLLNTQEVAAKMSMTAEEFMDERGHYICVLEKGEEGPKVRSFNRRITKSGKTFLCRMSTFVVSTVPDPFPRVPAELTHPMSNKRVAIVGLGSGGGEIALNLACAGVGFLDFFDADRLGPENYIRHILDRRDLGRNKISGLLDDLRDRNLPTTVEIEDLDVVLFGDLFRKALAKNSPDLLICATDSRESRRFLNVCAVAFKIPLIIAGILDSGRIGEVLLVLPRETACYECVRLQLGAALEASDSDQRPNTPYLVGEPIDLQSVVQRFDINFVASLATRLGLQVLDPKRYPRLPTEYLVWGRESGQEYALPFAFDYPLTVNFAKMLRRSDCPVCGTLTEELEGIDIDDKFEQILSTVDDV